MSESLTKNEISAYAEIKINENGLITYQCHNITRDYGTGEVNSTKSIDEVLKIIKETITRGRSVKTE